MEVLFELLAFGTLVVWYALVMPSFFPCNSFFKKTLFVGLVCGWFSSLLRALFLQELRFSPAFPENSNSIRNGTNVVEEPPNVDVSPLKV